MRFPFSIVEGFPTGALPASLANVSPVPSQCPEPQSPVPDQDASVSRKPPRRSAVALLFLPPEAVGAPANILLIRRSAHYGSHRGQIGLAGGRAEARDAGPVETLKREIHEELGIPGEALLFHGALPIRRAIDASEVMPCVVTARWSSAQIKAAPDEVASVHLAPWTSLIHDKRTLFAFIMFGVRRESALYRVDGTTVWGLTAAIINGADMLP